MKHNSEENYSETPRGQLRVNAGDGLKIRRKRKLCNFVGNVTLQTRSILRTFLPKILLKYREKVDH